MKEFLLTYWQPILAAVLAVVQVILVAILKKRPQLVDNSFIVHVMEWINQAEQIYKHGSDKKNYVLKEAKNYLGVNYREKDVSACIEYVLSSPQKKEVQNVQR